MNINIDSARDTLCKNILIYGYCKYENKGCVFSHVVKPTGSNGGAGAASGSGASTTGNSGANAAGSTGGSNVAASAAGGAASSGISSPALATAGTTVSTPTSTLERKRFNLNTPSFQPSTTSKFAASPKLKEIPTFVPEGLSHDVNGSFGDAAASVSANANANSSINSTPTASLKKFNVSTPSFTPSSFLPVNGNSSIINQGDISASSPILSQHTGPLGTPTGGNLGGPAGGVPGIPGGIPGGPAGIPGQGPTNPYSAPSSSDAYFQSSRSFPLQYHLYAPAPPPRLTIPLPPFETNAQSMFIANDLREALTKRNEATLQTLPRSNLPDHINIYHSLVPIDNHNVMVAKPPSKVFGVPTSVYKVFSNVDGNPYVLVRIENQSIIRIQNELPFHRVKAWKSLRCANVVQLQEAFTSMAFGGKHASLIVTYDYYPNSNTLQEQHIVRKLGGKLEPINEEVLTAYLVQIANALSSIHERGLAARESIDVTKIIVTSKNRIKLSGCGVGDILHYEESEDMSVYQQRDIKNFARLMIDLSLLLVQPNLRTGTELQSIKTLRTLSIFSEEYLNILEQLVGWEGSIQEFIAKNLASKLMQFINGLQDGQDYMESQLTGELENARLFRLVTKLNFILDRPENATDSQWKENGPKYIIKLFRDYVFNEVNEYGKPVLNLSRVLTCLNKLDAGIEEKIMLISEDEKSCVIVTYKEIKELIGTSFRKLMR
ncbi:PAN2-Pan3p deadenylation complex subunit Pan3p [[Candida] anglica]|uniref:PAN2-PAN3 deadenylation complex subunit PAN3 n=1 Tax=[Candida] anglica TaxID=148631 RepID=A0ABP0ED77_9ASCO